MVDLIKTFSCFRPRTALVAGDLMLDLYTIGTASRLSPESPVPVVQVEREERRAGGAGNVMLNLVHLGCRVKALGRVGADFSGRELKELLRFEGIDTAGILEDSVPTPVKNRVIAQNQQIVRIDREEVRPLSEEVEQQLIALLPRLLEGVDVVAISDYAKGTLSKNLLRALIAAASKQAIPVVVDPKGLDYAAYSGATLVKPNLGEAYAVARKGRGESLDTVAAAILKEIPMGSLMITRGGEGISTWTPQGGRIERADYSSQIREVKDVTGAGDTVLAVIAFSLANKIALSAAVRLANLAAGIVVERIGCASATLSELAWLLLQDRAGDHVLNSSHQFILREALQGKEVALVPYDSKKGFDKEVFFALQKGRKKDEVQVVYLTDENPDIEVAELFSSLDAVAFVLTGNEGIAGVTSWLQPTRVVTR